jgi:pimeloyl-ACP methyl ester carboxylesterase
MARPLKWPLAAVAAVYVCATRAAGPCMPTVRWTPHSIALAAALMAASLAHADDAPLAPFESAPCDFNGVAPEWAVQNRIDCGWLRVPESRDKPASRTLKLWVAIARAPSSTKRADPILYLHGGPGFATVDYVFPYFPKSKTWPRFREQRDIVFLDARGSGRSESAFCPDLGATLESIDAERLASDEALTRHLAALRACRTTLLAEGLDFGAYHSRAIVEDAEALRRALGVSQWNLYAISYGTRVGLEYLRQYPASVRSAILDSVFPPNSTYGAEQIASTAKAYEALQRSCNADPACRERFPDMLARLAIATRRLDAVPLSLDGRPITGGAFLEALWAMLITSEAAPWVPLAVDRAAKGDSTAIRRIVETFGGPSSFGSYNHGQAMTISCHEIQTGRTADTVIALTLRHPQLVPRDAIADATDQQCAVWQTEHAPMSTYAPVSSTVPVLLYGGEFDPATPFEDALLAARHLPNSMPVFVEGASHGAFYTDECTRGIAHAFLADPSARVDTACLENRAPTRIPTRGLSGFLDSMAATE